MKKRFGQWSVAEGIELLLPRHGCRWVRHGRDDDLESDCRNSLTLV